jgi:hypothetical protein
MSRLRQQVIKMIQGRADFAGPSTSTAMIDFPLHPSGAFRARVDRACRAVTAASPKATGEIKGLTVS